MDHDDARRLPDLPGAGRPLRRLHGDRADGDPAASGRDPARRRHATTRTGARRPGRRRHPRGRRGRDGTARPCRATGRVGLRRGRASSHVPRPTRRGPSSTPSRSRRTTERAGPSDRHGADRDRSPRQVRVTRCRGVQPPSSWPSRGDAASAVVAAIRPDARWPARRPVLAPAFLPCTAAARRPRPSARRPRRPTSLRRRGRAPVTRAVTELLARPVSPPSDRGRRDRLARAVAAALRPRRCAPTQAAVLDRMTRMAVGSLRLVGVRETTAPVPAPAGRRSSGTSGRASPTGFAASTRRPRSFDLDLTFKADPSRPPVCVITASAPSGRPQPWDLTGLVVRRSDTALVLAVGDDDRVEEVVRRARTAASRVAAVWGGVRPAVWIAPATDADAATAARARGRRPRRRRRRHGRSADAGGASRGRPHRARPRGVGVAAPRRAATSS